MREPNRKNAKDKEKIKELADRIADGRLCRNGKASTAICN